MFSTIKISLTTFFCSVALCAAEPKMIKLSPPQISTGTLSEKIVCTRPMRDGKFNISLEYLNGKKLGRVSCSTWTKSFKALMGMDENYRPKN